MTDRSTLETLEVKFTADDEQLQLAFKRIEKQSAAAIKTLRAMAAENKNLFSGLGSVTADATQEQQKAAKATREAVQVNEELAVTIKDLTDRVATSRNQWAGRVQDDASFMQSTAALKEELLKLAGANDLTANEMRKVSGAVAYAQRGLDSAAKVASRGGLAWTAQIGIANQLGQSLRGLGPAGAAASSAAMGISSAFGAMHAPIDLASLKLTNFISMGGRLVSLLPLITAAAGVSAVAGLAKMADSASKLAADLDLAARSTGMGVEALQEWRYAAEQSGVDADTFTGLLTSLQRRLGAAAEGNKSYAKAFRELGVDVRDAAGQMRSLEEVLPEVADGLARIENETKRVQLSTTIMNRSGANLTAFFGKGSEAIREMREEARQLGLIISGDAVMSFVEYGDEISKLKGQFETAKIEISAAFLPVLRDVLLPLLKDHAIPALQNTATAVGDFSDSLFDMGPAGVEFRAQMVANLKPLFQFVDIVSAAGNGFFAFANLVGVGVASVGTTLGALSVAMERFFGQWKGITEGMTAVELGSPAGILKMYQRISELDFSNLSPLNMTEVQQMANDATQPYWKQVEAFSKVANEAMERLRDPESYERMFEGVFQDLDLTPAATRAARDFGETFDKDLLESAAGTVKELVAMFGSLQHAQDQQGKAQQTFGLAVTPESRAAAQELVDHWEGIVESINAEFAKADASEAKAWVARLGHELQFGDKKPLDVLRLLNPAIEGLTGELSDLVQQGITSGAELDLLAEKFALLVTAANSAAKEMPELQTFLKPEEDGKGGSAGRTPQWIADAYKEAGEIARRFYEDQDTRSTAFGETINKAAEDIELFGRQINHLRNEGAGWNDPFLTGLVEQRQELVNQQALIDAVFNAPSGLIGLAERAGAAIQKKIPPALQGAADAVTGLLGTMQGLRSDEMLAGLLGQDFNRDAAEVKRLETEIKGLADQYDSLTVVEQLRLNQASSRLAALQGEAAAAEEAKKWLLEQKAAAEQLGKALNDLHGVKAVDATGGMADLVSIQQGLKTALEDTLTPGEAYQKQLRDLISLHPELFQHTDELKAIYGDLSVLLEGEASAALKGLTEQFEGLTGTGLTQAEELRNALMDLAEGTGDAAVSARLLLTQLGQFEGLGAIEVFNDLRTQILAMGSTPDPFEAMRNDIRKAAADLGLLPAELDSLLTLLGDVERSDAIKALDGQLRDAKDAVASLTGTGLTEFEALQVTLETVRASMEALGLETTEVDAILEQLGTAGKTSELNASLGQVQDALRKIGSAAGGELGEVINGLADMIGVAQKFASGDIAGAVVNVLTEIVSAISSVINANREWEASLDKLSDRYRSLTRETVDAISVSTQEAVKLWGFITIGSKTVMNDAATQLGIGWATSFLDAAQRALTGDDFHADFNLGLDKIIQEELMTGFMLTQAMQGTMQEVVEGFRAAWDEKDPTVRDAMLTDVRETMAGMEDELAQFYDRLDETFPERTAERTKKVAEEAKKAAEEAKKAAEEAAKAVQALTEALQGSADAAATLGLEVQQSELARMFELGAASLSEYRKGLEATARAEAGLARAQEQRSLQERRNAALEGLEGKERSNAAAVFDKEANAIDARFDESMASATQTAQNAVKSILGVMTDGLSGSFQSAFDNATFSGFVDDYKDAMHDTTRSALIAGFTESTAMKPLFDKLGSMISDAIVDGVFDGTTKGSIAAQIELITSGTEDFWKWMDELGFGFRDLNLDTITLSETIQKASDLMLNVPSLFKFQQATWDAAPARQTWSPNNMSSGSGVQPLQVNITHHGDVIGINDFEGFIQNSVRQGQELGNLSTAGLGGNT